MMTSWDRGYYSDAVYTCGYYREMSPAWLDYVALIQGHASPRRKDGDPFSYLELGCGMGLGLCLLAAAYPEGNFVGVDFNPSHIAHATGLAIQLGLQNIHFHEIDFLDLRNNLISLQPNIHSNNKFLYVAAHGIISWIVEAVRDSLLTIASECLHPGGLFYCSYNTFPGWLSRTTFQKLYWLERERSDKSTVIEPFERALEHIKTLLGTEKVPTPLGSSYPSLRDDLAWIDLSQPDYLCGEYANEGWEPSYVSDIHKSCLSKKLTFLGSATLPECFEQLLAPSLQETILRENNPLIRQQLLDLATNKSFRRDVFVKGFNRLTRTEAEDQYSQLLITRLEELPTVPQSAKKGKPDASLNTLFNFTTSFGQVIGDPEIYGPIAAGINSGDCTVGQLQATTGCSSIDLQLILSLFLDCNWIALHRREVDDPCIQRAQRCNQVILSCLHSGRPFYYLVAPSIGLCTPFSLVESYIYSAYSQGLEGDMHSACVLLGLEQLGVHLVDSAKQTIHDSSQKLELIQSLSASFLSQRLPMLIRLGALPNLFNS